MDEGKYVYCFVEGNMDSSTGITGMGGQGSIYYIPYKDISAAVSDTPYMEYDPSRENALNHERAVQQLMKTNNLVPCNFGNVFKSRDDVLLFLEKAYSYIAQNLQKVRGKMEVGLRVFWQKENFSKEIETDEIVKLRDSLMEGAGRSDYYAQIELGKTVQKRVEKRRKYYSGRIYEPLCAYAEDAVSNEPSNPMMVIDAAFLILKSREGEFDRQVELLMKQYSDGFRFSYSGPWPPYNFTDVVMEG